MRRQSRGLWTDPKVRLRRCRLAGIPGDCDGSWGSSAVFTYGTSCPETEHLRRGVFSSPLCFHRYLRMHLHFRETGLRREELEVRMRAPNTGLLPKPLAPNLALPSLHLTPDTRFSPSFVFNNISGWTCIFACVGFCATGILPLLRHGQDGHGTLTANARPRLKPGFRAAT